MVHYLEVILPLSVATPYTYAVDDAVMPRPMPGARVLVPLRKHKIYTGVVWQYVAKAPEGVEVKMLIAVLDDRPILTAQQLQLWAWMADYYMSALGDVYRAAVPSALKLESETRFMIHSAFVASEPLPESLQSILDVMRDGQFYTAAELARMMGVRQVMSQLNRLVLLGAVLTQESVEDMYKPRMKTVVSLFEAWRQESKLQELLDQLGRRAPRRQETLLQFLQLWQSSRGPVDRQELLSREQVSSSAYNALVSQGVLEQQQVQVDRLQPQQPTRASYPLNSYQQQAFDQILESWKQKPIVLLHGVTSSGKTELYIHLIEQQLRQGKQVLYLVPEIALTTQLTNRLATVFGPKLGVYHSRFSDAERVEIYQNLIHQKSYQLILGVRSSVFLPFSNLGLVIVDEEHEASYKQQDPAPRYHARNVALVLARLHNAKTLLGTATPSISSYYHAVSGRYGLVKLMHRYKDISLPEISLLDLRESRRKRLMTEHFSDRLVDLMRAALNRHE
ncbi:MAG: DEAD/DEAH box helicase family protein, partial [Paludibacteraceae bacterium]|nr:DEAD/DEAH box helicase family protein [Paludibacteraceae bacterium]